MAGVQPLQASPGALWVRRPVLPISCGSLPILSEHPLELTSGPSQLNSSQQRGGRISGGVASCPQHFTLV